MKSRFDAVIVGAGPAGASAAIWLANAGWSVALVEKYSFPRRKVCGECLAASNFSLLNDLGIGRDFFGQAGPEIRQVGVMRGSRSMVADLPRLPNAQHQWGRALGREVLDTLLLERARAVGATVLQPWTVQKINGIAGAHQCTVRDAVSEKLEIVQTPVVILAHGSWEPLPADRAVQRLARSGSDLLAFKANFRGASLPDGLLQVLMFPGGYGGIVLGDRGLLTLACCIRADRLDTLRRAAPGKPAAEVVQDMLQRECNGVKDALQRAVREGVWLASGPLAPGVRLRSDEEVFRIGNAAGEVHPIIGEGMSMALQSAWLLCSKLVEARSSSPSPNAAEWQRKVHTSYAAEWSRRFVPRMRLAATFAHLAMRPAASGALLAVLERWPSLLTRGATWAGKVNFKRDATYPVEANLVRSEPDHGRVPPPSI